MDMTTALLAALAYFICYGGNWLLGQCMIERPIVVGAVAGILLGDPTTGIIMGASLEAIFMGAVNIGGQVSAEPASATVFAVVFATQSGIDAEAALALAVPIGVLMAFVSMFINNIAFSAFVPFIDRAAERDDVRGITMINFGAWILRFGIFATIMFFGVLMGQAAVETLVSNIPDVIMRGLVAAGNLMPAVGFAILLKMLWSKELSLYFLLGFILVVYLQLPLIAVAAIGAVIVAAIAQRDMELLNLKASGVSDSAKASTDDVEDFLS
ncbi:MAG: PTS sugar transporter subunit IIC [Collinsella sp.]|nr:PTS sugar transporter subunit IIC [Collinsella sp.]